MALQGLRVLVVENDEMNATLLELQLAQFGAQVLGPAGTVAVALQLAGSGNPDLAVLDFRLGGGETSEAVATHLVTAGIPFVLATGLAADALPRTFGAGVVLAKPYDSAELRQALVDALAWRTPSAN